jgi:uncharacterized protein DUF4238
MALPLRRVRSYTAAAKMSRQFCGIKHVMQRNPQRQDRSKHQHWVPQFYLRYFATPETRDTEKPQVWIFSKDPADGDETLTNVRNVCGKRYLYSPRRKDGERCWALDDRVAHLEGLLGQLWPALATGFVDLGDEHIRKALALFIAVMHLRHPDTRRQVEEVHRRLLSCYMSGPTQPDGTPHVESVEVKGKIYPMDLSDWHTYKNWQKDDHDQFFVDFVESEAGRMAKHLLTKRWSVVVSDTETFITTDKPVVVKHLTREPVGYGTPGAIVTFPLSPTRLVVLDDLHDEPSNQYYPLANSNAGHFNFTVWHGASRFLITGRPVTEVLSEMCAAGDAASDA